MGEKILVFIPAYNCSVQIGRVLDQLDEEMWSFISEAIVVNNRSTDNTEATVLEYLGAHPERNIRLLTNDENYGLGGSHKVAFQYAVDQGYDFVIVLHGDDQGDIHDILPVLRSGRHREMDCCLGSRFMKGSRIQGYSLLRIVGNYAFNALFSVVTWKGISDLGSGLNLYRIKSFRDGFYRRLPDTQYFNNAMILASTSLKQRMTFFPISWREDDQVSNTKLFNFTLSLFNMVFRYFFFRKRYILSELRKTPREEYSATRIAAL